jgi:hypothetical protein
LFLIDIEKDLSSLPRFTSAKKVLSMPKSGSKGSSGLVTLRLGNEALKDRVVLNRGVPSRDVGSLLRGFATLAVLLEINSTRSQEQAESQGRCERESFHASGIPRYTKRVKNGEVGLSG